MQCLLSHIPFSPIPMKYYLVAQPVPPESPKRRPHKLKIVEVSQADYDYSWFPRPPEFIDARYDQGALCFVAFSDGQPTACLWLIQGGFFEDTIRAQFSPQPTECTAWDFDVFIHPEYRLGRTFMHLWEHAFDWMRAREIRWTMSRINAFNLSSVHSHRRLGARFLHHVTFWHWGKLQLSLSDASPRIQIGMTNIPEFTIHAPSDFV